MTISAISSFSASQVSSFQNYRQAFKQLTDALQSGDMTAAQNAYNTLSSSPIAQGTGPFARALQQIGTDLQKNDLKGAQDALAALQQQQAHRGHHHHHQGGVSPLSNTPDPSSSNGANVNTDSDGNSDGTTILDITITVESTNKLDIKA